MTRVVRRETLIIQVNKGWISDLKFQKSYIWIDQACVELLH